MFSQKQDYVNNYRKWKMKHHISYVMKWAHSKLNINCCHLTFINEASPKNPSEHTKPFSCYTYGELPIFSTPSLGPTCVTNYNRPEYTAPIKDQS